MSRCFGNKNSAWGASFSASGLTPTLELTDSKPSGQTSFNLLIGGNATSVEQVSQTGQIVTLVESLNPSTAAQSLVATLDQRLTNASIPTQRFRWGSDISQLKGQSCIVLLDLEDAHLKNPSAQDLAAVQFLLSQANNVLWVSGPLGADSALMTGLARSARNEIAGLQLRTLEFSDELMTTTDSFSDFIARVWNYHGSDNEFVVNNGTLQVGRFVEDDSRNNEMDQMLGRQEKPLVPTVLEEKPQALKLCVRQIGMLDSLCYEPDPLATAPLEPGELEVEVKASGIKYVVSSERNWRKHANLSVSGMSWLLWVKSPIGCLDSRAQELFAACILERPVSSPAIE